MFRVIDKASAGTVSIHIDGHQYQVPAGLSVAAAVLLCDINKIRTTPVSDSPRLPYCMMGICFDCLAQIDGVPNQRACQVTVRDDMVIEYQPGAAEPGHEA